MRLSSIALASLLCPILAYAQNGEHAERFRDHAPWQMSAGELEQRALRRYAAGARPNLRRKVFGYVPYWGGDWTQTRFDLLTSLSYFAVAIDKDGDVVRTNGWGGATSSALIAEAKRHGIKTSVSFTLFGSTDIGALLGDAGKRAHAIDTIVAQVQRGGAEGANIDFEFVPRSAKAQFVTFMRDLGAALRAVVPDAEISIAMPAIDWNGAYDYDELVAVSDLLFIMAYGYHWTGGNPGPLSLPQSGSIWGRYNLEWTIDDYVQYGGPDVLDKLVLGLPFYGNDWPSTSGTVPGTQSADGRAVFYRDMPARLMAHPRQWDPESLTPYQAYQSGGQWHQVWYDDGESWRAKLDLIERRGVAGVGIWALTYERGLTDVWDSIEDAVVPPPVPPDAGVPPDAAPMIDAGFALDVTERDAASSDATEIDAGAPDAGAPDLGADEPEDAGTWSLSDPPPDPVVEVKVEEASCQAARGSAPWLLGALFLLWRRRKLG